mgnify:CR=1 FL=1
MSSRLRLLRLLAVWSMLLPVFTSCIREYLEECPQEYALRFRYDYNMKFKDLFADQVEDLSVYVFDKDGKYVRTVTDRGERLRDSEYKLILPLAPGHYCFVVWAGLDGGCFNPVSLQSGISEENDLSLLLYRNDNGEVPCDRPLAALWHSRLEAVEVFGPGTLQTDTLNLIKDTNTIRIILQQRDGSLLRASDFDIRIDCPAGNGLLAHDNDLLPDRPLVYRPYALSDGVSENAPRLPQVTAGFSVSRLTVGDAMRLRIGKKAGGGYLIDIPLVDYLLMTQHEQDARILSDQEYLDRQDVYSILLYLDGDRWFDSLIIINGWALRPGSVDL